MSMAKDGELHFATLPGSFKKQKPCQIHCGAKIFLLGVTYCYLCNFCI